MKNNWVSCQNFLSSDYPDFEIGMGIECYNGTKGIIVATNSYELLLDSCIDPIHIMNVKSYLPLEN